MLSSFLPPVPSLPSDPPEHFPLRKTGERDRQVGDPMGISGEDLGCGMARGEGSRAVGVGLSITAAPAVSEPNLKLRYKPKKSLERRKNPLLRKESAPPSLRRRTAETLGGEHWQHVCGADLVPLSQVLPRQGSPSQIYRGWLCWVCSTHSPGGRVGAESQPLLCWLS